MFILNKYDDRFKEIAKPIVSNTEYQKMKDIKHHDESVLEHCLDVAYFSYKIAQKLNLDIVSTIRGALLHDFYLYKFNKKTWKIIYTSMIHAKNHPKIALVNAQSHFELNKIERDIILKHMFPIRIPKYRESWIVSFVDKTLAIYEYSNRIGKIRFKKMFSFQKI